MSGRNNPDHSRCGGSVTVEASLVLPVLLCAFISVIFIIKAVYACELINHALDETASEMAMAGYIYHLSGLRDLHDTVRNGINDKAEIFKDQLESFFNAYESLNAAKSAHDYGLPDTDDGAALFADAGKNFAELMEKADRAVYDPSGELKSIACYIADGAFNDAKTQLFIPVVKLYMKKYLTSGGVADADMRLKLLGIENGFEGLDFSGSSFLSDNNEDLDIVAAYRVKLPLPIRFVPSLKIMQRVKVRAWMGGDETAGVLDGKTSADDLWALDNFQRGLEIRKLFGANLPSNFPVIARFSSGKAVMIKSVDLTAQSYQTGDNAKKLLEGYIDELADYRGQEKPWGSGGIIIKNEDIKSRELLLVIPQNKLTEANEVLLSSMAATAETKGVSLVIKRYGTKHEKKDGDGENGPQGDTEGS